MNSAINGLSCDTSALHAQFRRVKDMIFNECMNSEDDALNGKFDKMIHILSIYKQLFNDIESIKIQLRAIDERIKSAEQMTL